MEIITHESGNDRVAEVVADQIIIQTAEDGLALLGDLYYQNFDKIILHSKNITPLFFDLSNGLAGEILQKFSNYRVKLAIVGNFGELSSKSLRDFIYESNQGKTVNFVSSAAEALEKKAHCLFGHFFFQFS